MTNSNVIVTDGPILSGESNYTDNSGTLHYNGVSTNEVVVGWITGNPAQASATFTDSRGRTTTLSPEVALAAIDAIGRQMHWQNPYEIQAAHTVAEAVNIASNGPRR